MELTENQKKAQAMNMLVGFGRSSIDLLQIKFGHEKAAELCDQFAHECDKFMGFKHLSTTDLFAIVMATASAIFQHTSNLNSEQPKGILLP